MAKHNFFEKKILFLKKVFPNLKFTYEEAILFFQSENRAFHQNNILKKKVFSKQKDFFYVFLRKVYLPKSWLYSGSQEAFLWWGTE